MTKTVVVYSPSRFENEVWLPALWCQAKTYYEQHGQHQDDWCWAPCIADIHSNDLAKVKEILQHTEPDVFAVSLYVWNYTIGHQVAKWVKQRWPDCFVVTGGPHQYFKHDINWFRDHPYIDASLAGDCYGELCIQQILDNLDDSGGLDHNTVTDLCYPTGVTRQLAYSKHRSTVLDKKKFDYNWPSFAKQKKHVDNFVNHARLNNSECRILSILETTRGCPYGCVYCDWGGGINTAVIKKDVSTVKKDLELLCSYDLKYLYIADANLGIFGNRDVEIIKNLVDYRSQYQTNIKLGYGGFAKTPNKLNYIRQILELDFANQLSNSKEIKISQQSLDGEVLKNIDRKNIDLTLQLTEFAPLAKKEKLPLFVEMILGLPGQTIEKFYKELDVLGENRLSVMWYEWLLLPEAPAYSHEYRKKFSLVTLTKQKGWAWNELNSERNVVIQTYSYTTNDYLEMLLSSSLYHMFVQGGLYKDSVDWIQKQGIKTGQMIQTFYHELAEKFDYTDQWLKILSDPDCPCHFTLPTGQDVYVGYYFAMLAFVDPQKFFLLIEKCFLEKFSCPKKILKKDQKRTITIDNANTQTWLLDYSVPTGNNNVFGAVFEQFVNYRNSQQILRARHRILDAF
jgi:radical SAM superfamily enzyme YgiQ (UPF0313 family)